MGELQIIHILDYLRKYLELICKADKFGFLLLILVKWNFHFEQQSDGEIDIFISSKALFKYEMITIQFDRSIG